MIPTPKYLWEISNIIIKAIITGEKAVIIYSEELGYGVYYVG